jgi:hypothetical protein
MKEDTIVDYAMPLMQIERIAKDIHDLCLEHKYDAAHAQVFTLLLETCELHRAIKHIKEKACPTSPSASA